MATRAYSETVPAGTDAANTLHTIIQDKAKDLRERLAQGDHKFAGYVAAPPATADNNDGKHCVGIKDNLGDAGSCVIAYDNAGTTPLLTLYGATHASARQLVAAADYDPGGVEPDPAPVKFVGHNVTTGDNPGHRHTRFVPIISAPFSTGSLLFPGVVNNYMGAMTRWTKDAAAGVSTVVALHARLVQHTPATNLVLEFRKTNGAPAAAANVASDAIASVVIGTVTILAGQYGADTTGLSVALTDGEFIIIKMISGTFAGPATPNNITFSAGMSVTA